MKTDMVLRIVRAAGCYKQAVQDLQDAGFCVSKAMKAAWAYYAQ